MITPEKNLWHCLGACQDGRDGDRLGDESRRRVSFRHAVELLRKGVPSLAANQPLDRPPPKKASTQKLPSVVNGARTTRSSCAKWRRTTTRR